MNFIRWIKGGILGFGIGRCLVEIYNGSGLIWIYGLVLLTIEAIINIAEEYRENNN